MHRWHQEMAKSERTALRLFCQLGFSLCGLVGNQRQEK